MIRKDLHAQMAIMPGNVHGRASRMQQGPPSGGQQDGEGNVMNAAQLQGLQSDALRMLTLCEGCPQRPFRQLGASGLALEDL